MFPLRRRSLLQAFPKWRSLLRCPPRWRSSLQAFPKRRSPLMFLSEAAELTSGLPEAAEPAIACSKVAAPHTPLWWPLVLSWVSIPPALPQSPGPPPAHGPGPPIPSLRPRSAVPLDGRLGTSGSRSLEDGSCHESGPCISSSHHQRSPSPVLPDSIPQTPHTCHLLHPQLFPIVMNYLYTTLLLLCLVY